jgi:hypothetical protein
VTVTTVALRKDAALSTTVAPATAYTGGEPVLVTYVVRNAGKDQITGAKVAAKLPPELPVDAVTGCTFNAGTCTFGAIPPGQFATGLITLRPGRAVSAAVSGTVTATFGRAGADEDAKNDTASSATRVLQPRLTMTPAVGPSGSVAAVTGRDFPPGTAVNLGWSRGINPPSRPVIVKRDGTFTAQALVFPSDSQGARGLHASGLRFGGVAEPQFLVVARTLSPPEFAGPR